jgi:hypothetical protein
VGMDEWVVKEDLGDVTTGAVLEVARTILTEVCVVV